MENQKKAVQTRYLVESLFHRINHSFTHSLGTRGSFVRAFQVFEEREQLVRDTLEQQSSAKMESSSPQSSSNNTSLGNAMLLYKNVNKAKALLMKNVNKK